MSDEKLGPNEKDSAKTKELKSDIMIAVQHYMKTLQDEKLSDRTERLIRDSVYDRLRIIGVGIAGLITILGALGILSWFVSFSNYMQLQLSNETKKVKADFDGTVKSVKSEFDEKMKTVEQKRMVSFEKTLKDATKAEIQFDLLKKLARKSTKELDELMTTSRKDYSNFQKHIDKAKEAKEMLKDIYTSQKNVLNQVSKSSTFQSAIVTQMKGILDPMPIGSVIASMLTPKEFKDRVRGDDKWVLADGRKCEGSTYFNITGKSKTPDLRGMFLRGLNSGRNDGWKDPDGTDRVVGSYQPDNFNKHNHTTYLSSNYGSEAKGGKGVEGSVYKGQKSGTTMEGGNENRPKNIAVYYYIKIN